MADQTPTEEGQNRTVTTTEQLNSALSVACKGFVVGVGLHAGVNLLAGITTKRLLNSPLPYLKGLINTDTLRFGSFIALSGSTYKLIITVLKKRYKETRGWHAVVAGLAAGFISAIDDPSRRHTLSLFISARALGALVTTLHRRGYLPSIPHFVILMFAVCQSFIVVAITKFPWLMPQHYYRSVLKWSMCYTDEILQVYFRQPSSQFIPCDALLHSGPCDLFALKDFYHCFLLYVKIYTVLYSIPLVLFRSKMLLHTPGHALSGLIQNTFLSALFLAIDGIIIKYSMCLMRNMLGRPPPVPSVIPALAGLMGVAGLLVERESRRLELLYYVIPQVFYGIWKFMCVKKPLYRIPYGTVWMFALSLAAIMHAFEREKESISPLLNRALKFLLNEPNH